MQNWGVNLKNINVVHISQTPLVGAPGKIAYFLNNLDDIWAVHYFESDYPEPLKGFFNCHSVKLDSSKVGYNDTVDLFEYQICHADVIHIHNNISPGLACRIADLAPSAKFIYQIHSPLREPPLHCFQDQNLPFKFALRLVVAQVYPRLYPEYVMVPNLIDSQGCILANENTALRVMFSPTHRRSERQYYFSTKFSPHFDEVMADVEKSLGNKIIFSCPQKPLPPELLYEWRKLHQVTIDEIETGGFHQVSYEGLSCGNVVINNADDLSLISFATALGTGELPPFIRASESVLKDVLEKLASDRDYCESIRRASYEYYVKYMKPQELVKKFANIYREVLS